MTYEILSSGSKGNAVLLERHALLDCGVSYKKLKPYAGTLGSVRHDASFVARTATQIRLTNTMYTSGLSARQVRNTVRRFTFATTRATYLARTQFTKTMKYA